MCIDEKYQYFLDEKKCLNPCPAEQIKKPYPVLIFSQSDYLINVVDINSHT